MLPFLLEIVQLFFILFYFTQNRHSALLFMLPSSALGEDKGDLLSFFFLNKASVSIFLFRNKNGRRRFPVTLTRKQPRVRHLLRKFGAGVRAK